MSDLSGFGPSSGPRVSCFSVHAPTDPGAMPRVLEVFAKRGLVPTRWHSTVSGARGEELQMDVQVAGLDADTEERLAACLRALVCVSCVLSAVEGRTATA